MSERPLVPLTAPLMDWRTAPSAPEMHHNNCHRGYMQTDTVTWRQAWHGDKGRDGNRAGSSTRERLKVSVYVESMFEGK